jgi:hypothetical protein
MQKARPIGLAFCVVRTDLLLGNSLSAENSSAIKSPLTLQNKLQKRDKIRGKFL